VESANAAADVGENISSSSSARLKVEGGEVVDEVPSFAGGTMRIMEEGYLSKI